MKPTRPANAFSIAPRAPSRRRFLQIAAGSGLPLGLAAGPAWQWLHQPDAVVARETRLLMGTVVNLAAVGPDMRFAQAAVQATLGEMERLIAIFDHRQPASALGRLNANGQLMDAPRELLAALKQANHLSTISGGAFDVTVKPLLDARQASHPLTPELQRMVDFRQVILSDGAIALGRPGMGITLDGLAKGAVVDGAVGILRALGYDSVLVEAGGDLLAHGAPPERPWRVGIRDPRGDGDALATVAVLNQAMATSGDYLNAFSADFEQHHIIDPRTGASPTELASATVIAASAALADALSTTMMVLGADASLALAEQQAGVEALLVTKDRHTYQSAGFPGDVKHV